MFHSKVGSNKGLYSSCRVLNALYISYETGQIKVKYRAYLYLASD